MNYFQMLTCACFIIKSKLNSARGQTKCQGKSCHLSYVTFLGSISRVSSDIQGKTKLIIQRVECFILQQELSFKAQQERWVVSVTPSSSVRYIGNITIWKWKQSNCQVKKVRLRTSNVWYTSKMTTKETDRAALLHKLKYKFAHNLSYEFLLCQ